MFLYQKLLGDGPAPPNKFHLANGTVSFTSCSFWDWDVSAQDPCLPHNMIPVVLLLGVPVFPLVLLN